MFGSKISRSEILIILITSVSILTSFSPFIPVYRKEVLKCNWQKNTCIVYRTRYLGSVETQILMPPNSIDSVGFRGKRIRYGRHQKINKYRIILRAKDGSEQQVFADTYNLYSSVKKKSNELTYKFRSRTNIIIFNR